MFLEISGYIQDPQKRHLPRDMLKNEIIGLVSVGDWQELSNGDLQCHVIYLDCLSYWAEMGMNKLGLTHQNQPFPQTGFTKDYFAINSRLLSVLWMFPKLPLHHQQQIQGDLRNLQNQETSGETVA